MCSRPALPTGCRPGWATADISQFHRQTERRDCKILWDGLGVRATGVGIPLKMVQKLVGHAQLSTTAIYADAVRAEEKEFASRVWG